MAGARKSMRHRTKMVPQHRSRSVLPSSIDGTVIKTVDVYDVRLRLI